MEEEVSGTVSEMVSENPEVEDVEEIVVVSEVGAVAIGAVVGTEEGSVAEVVVLGIGVRLRGTLVATDPHPETLAIDLLRETLMTDLQETVMMTGKVMTFMIIDFFPACDDFVICKQFVHWYGHYPVILRTNS